MEKNANLKQRGLPSQDKRVEGPAGLIGWVAGPYPGRDGPFYEGIVGGRLSGRVVVRAEDPAVVERAVLDAAKRR